MLLNIVNDAGSYLCAHHPWSWLRKRQMHLDLRAKVTLAGASLDATGKLLTVVAGDVANYTRVIGDEVELTAGTAGVGVLIPGFYEILAKTATLLTLRTAASTGTVTAIAGTIETNSIALPSDFKSIVPVNSVDREGGVIPGLIWGTPEQVGRVRSSVAGHDSLDSYHACLGQAGPTPAPANEPLTYIIEIAPTPNTNARDAFQGWYNARWRRVIDANEVLVLPEDMEGIFFTLCEHYAKGRLESDERGLALRLKEWEADPSVIGAKRDDGTRQPTYGIMRGGAIQQVRMGRHQSVPSRFTVNDPP
jgi:hypothetical protein